MHVAGYLTLQIENFAGVGREPDLLGEFAKAATGELFRKILIEIFELIFSYPVQKQTAQKHFTS